MSTNDDGPKGPSNSGLEPADTWPDNIIEINAEPQPPAPEVVPPRIVADPIALQPDYPKRLVGWTPALEVNGKNQRDEKRVSHPIVVLSYGSGKFARAVAERNHASVFTPDEALIAFENQVPLATRSNIERSTSDGSSKNSRRLHPLRFNEWRVMRDHRTDRPPHSADVIVVEQAHLSPDLKGTAAEIKRLARPGAGFMIIGYQRFVVADTPLLNEWMEFEWQQHLKKFVNVGERYLATGFHDLVIPNSRDVFHDLPKVMTKKLNLLELINGHFDAWPVVQRLDAGSGTTWHDMMKSRDQIAKLWGAHPKARKEVRWELSYRIGFLD